jgi:aspartate-semialdehyde dehydrogenase
VKSGYNVAVVGATGNAGMVTLRILSEREFPLRDIVAIASTRTLGRVVSCGNRALKTQKISDINWSDIDLAFFCAGEGVSSKNAEIVADRGCIVIDKSSYFRQHPKVPLIIPEINLDTLEKGASYGIVSTPNCVVTPLVMTLKALSEVASLKRVVVSTYQSVSGAGRRAIDELYNQSKEIMTTRSSRPEVFSKQIAFNILPQVGNFYESGISEEEEKITCETRKILMADVKIAVTCVRVPVFIGHSMSVACEFSKALPTKNIRNIFEKIEGVIVIDRRGEESGYVATPIDVQGEDAVFVSRIRKDTSVKNGLLYWIACDNLRKGAALNSVQIAESMIKIDPSLSKFRKTYSRTKEA